MILNQSFSYKQQVYMKMYASKQAESNHGMFNVGQDYKALIHENPTLEIILGVRSFVTWIYNVYTMQYEFISSNVESLLGYTSKQLMAKDIYSTKEFIHPDDLPFVGMFAQKVWEFMLLVPVQYRNHHKFNCDYRLCKPNGTYLYILEQNTILHTDSRGNVTHLLGTSSEITDWKNNEVLAASILSQDNAVCMKFTSVNRNLNSPTVLSKREQEIVKLVAKGYNSKHIADRLSISFHTVTTHRKKMSEKTKTKTSGELVQFAISNGLI